jgi:hypothetical protein
MACLSHLDAEDPPALADDGYPAGEEAECLSHIDNVRFTQQLIQEISSATLKNDKLEPEMLERL